MSEKGEVRGRRERVREKGEVRGRRERVREKGERMKEITCSLHATDLLNGCHYNVLGIFLHGHDILYVGWSEREGRREGITFLPQLD